MVGIHITRYRRLRSTTIVLDLTPFVTSCIMSLAKTPTASSISTGFFQGYPVIPPAYTRANDGIDHDTGDIVLANIVRLYLPFPLPSELDQSLHDFARQCLDPETLRLSVDAENNQPTLHSLNTFGGANNINPLRTSEGWKALKDIQTRAGIVAHGYKYVGDGTYNRRSFQFALSHLWSSSSAGVTCPAAMSDGAAILIARHLSRRDAPIVAGQDAATLHRVLAEAHARLTSFDPAYAWTSGQWMTERPGGSDVSRTETLARLASPDDLAADDANYGGRSVDAIDMPLGPYIVDGFKWFSSATDADMVVLLAQSDKGLSAFYAPMKRTSIAANGKKIHVMNGVRISRLKNKLGTKALPTAELEIKGMRAWLLGEEGKGVREISAILNATRLWTAVGATAGWGRGLTISKTYAKVRKIKGEHLLVDNRQHLRWIADETVKYRACVHFAHFGVALLGLSEADDQTEVGGMRTQAWLPQSQNDASLLLRILTPVMKAQCSLWSTLGLRECMESLGGVGYCENQEDDGLLNLARIFRDSAVNSIWEGSKYFLSDFVNHF